MDLQLLIYWIITTTLLILTHLKLLLAQTVLLYVIARNVSYLPTELPFEACEDNRAKLQEYLLTNPAPSTLMSTNLCY